MLSIDLQAGSAFTAIAGLSWFLPNPGNNSDLACSDVKSVASHWTDNV